MCSNVTITFRRFHWSRRWGSTWCDSTHPRRKYQASVNGNLGRTLQVGTCSKMGFNFQLAADRTMDRQAHHQVEAVGKIVS